MHLFESVDSTMERAARLAAEADGPDGLVVVADLQTAGRGRRGRVWIAPPGNSVMLSFVAVPGLPATRLPEVGMAVAVATVDALRELAGAGPGSAAPVGIKWPNDMVTADDRKLGGLLMETWGAGGAIVGLGVNVHRFQDLPAGAAYLADIGISASRSRIAGAILRHTGRRYAALRDGGSMLDPWRRRLTTLGREVEVHTAGGTRTGRAEDVAPDGALAIRWPNGERALVYAADVSIRSVAG